MGAKMFECGSEAWLCCGLTGIFFYFRHNTAGFSALLVTMDENLIYLYDPETKEQSK